MGVKHGPEPFSPEEIGSTLTPRLGSEEAAGRWDALCAPGIRYFYRANEASFATNQLLIC